MNTHRIILTKPSGQKFIFRFNVATDVDAILDAAGDLLVNDMNHDFDLDDCVEVHERLVKFWQDIDTTTLDAVHNDITGGVI